MLVGDSEGMEIETFQNQVILKNSKDAFKKKWAKVCSNIAKHNTFIKDL